MCCPGAVEFLTKPFRQQDLLDAVQQAIGRDRAARDLETKLAGLRARYELLTPREREVTACVVSGMLNKQIAAELGTTEKTIDPYDPQRPGVRKRAGCEGRSTSLLHSWFVQRGDGLILRTLSPNFALTPKLQHYPLECPVVSVPRPDGKFYPADLSRTTSAGVAGDLTLQTAPGTLIQISVPCPK